MRLYNYKFALPDDRDYKFVADLKTPLPKKVDLRENIYFPSVLNQGNLGSCVSNSVANCIRYVLGKLNGVIFMPSRLFLYYNTRVLVEKSNPKEDTGVMCRGMCKAISKYFICEERYYPYDICKFANEPSVDARPNAILHKGFKYELVDNGDIQQVKGALARGLPVVFGIYVYAGFESAYTERTGVVRMPKSGEQEMGGHCMTLVGYNDDTKMFLFLNSYGVSWGKAGFGEIPYSYITNTELASDFWVLTFVS